MWDVTLYELEMWEEEPPFSSWWIDSLCKTCVFVHENPLPLILLLICSSGIAYPEPSSLCLDQSLTLCAMSIDMSFFQPPDSPCRINFRFGSSERPWRFLSSSAKFSKLVAGFDLMFWKLRWSASWDTCSSFSSLPKNSAVLRITPGRSCETIKKSLIPFRL